MYSNRALRTILISLVLVLGPLLSVLVIVSPVGADSTSGETTFYFKDILGIEEIPEYGSMGMSVLVSQTPPTKQNDSVYPPNLFDGFKLKPEEWLVWFAFYFVDDLTGEYGDELGDLLEGFKLFFPNPLRIVETYECDGSEAIEIDGDVSFDLHFSSRMASKFGSNDEVNVALYSLSSDSLLPVPNMIKNKTVEITPELLKKINEQTVTIENVNHTLEPGDSLLFKIELIPGNKTAAERLKKEKPILEELGDWALDMLKNIANSSGNPTLQNITELIDEISSLADEFNITKEDASEILNSMISSSLVYDSISHPSSVTLPFKAPDASEDENTKIYYLHSGNKMDETKPTKQDSSQNNLESSISWDGSDINRSKILKAAAANLYINHKDIAPFKENIKTTASLFNEGTKIASCEVKLGKTQELLQTPNNLIAFSFSNLDENAEITYDTYLSLEISASNYTGFGSSLTRSAELLYDSSEFPSSLKLEFKETDNIKINADLLSDDKKIIPIGSVKYALNVTSNEADNIVITKQDFSDTESEKWNISIDPISFSILGDGYKTVNIVITSTFNDVDADKYPLEVNFSATGKTGKDTIAANAEVSKDAVDYDVEITVPPERKIEHGTNDTYHFIIKNNNTGVWPDSYTIEASSENNWTVECKPTTVNGLAAGGGKNINVTLHVPKDTEIVSDLLTFTVTSEGGSISITANVTTTVIGPNAFEGIYGFFESAAEDLGLDEIFGSLAPAVLAAILVIIVFFILVIVVFILTTKSAVVICFERIREISPEENARFEITIKNPTKKTRSYELLPQENLESSKWDASLDLKRATIKPGQSKTVVLTVKPTDVIEPDDWAEVDVVVKTEGRQKSEKITTMTLIKDSKAKLSISGVAHWPRSFKRGDRVTTYFKVENKGNASASGVDVILYINDKEKNKVDDVIIPAGGYADIRMPWIVRKSKNEINIVVR